MTIANAIWLATAELHRENQNAVDFSVQEIIERVIRENLVDGFRPGLQVHASKHCVASKSPNPGPHRMLHETTRGRRRLFRRSDPFHKDRRNGKVRPEKKELPERYQPLVDWYDTVYSQIQPPAASGHAGGESFSRPDPSAPMARRINGFPISETAFVNSTGGFIIPENLREELGIHEGTRLSISLEDARLVVQPITEDYIHRLVGCCKGEDSLVEAREREHKIEKKSLAS